MVWATHAMHRSPGPPAFRTQPPCSTQEDGGRIPQTALCGCGATAILAAGRLPKSWMIVDGEAKCGDCLAGTPIDIDLDAMREVLRRKEAQPIGGLPIARPNHGCRISDEIVCGFAAIEMRAGAKAPDGRDEAISFLLDAHGIDQLIIELSGIRAELLASKHPGSPAYERSSPCAQ